jgi:hypothetical protein
VEGRWIKYGTVWIGVIDVRSKGIGDRDMVKEREREKMKMKIYSPL